MRTILFIAVASCSRLARYCQIRIFFLPRRSFSPFRANSSPVCSPARCASCWFFNYSAGLWAVGPAPVYGCSGRIILAFLFREALCSGFFSPGLYNRYLFSREIWNRESSDHKTDARRVHPLGSNRAGDRGTTVRHGRNVMITLLGFTSTELVRNVSRITFRK